MQNLVRIIDRLKRDNPAVTTQDLWNTAREYLQILILRIIYQSKHGTGLSFMGGTCLRLCHGLKRYSEDLDFALDGDHSHYDFEDMNRLIRKNLSFRNLEIEVSVGKEKTVQKSFVKAAGLLQAIEASSIPGQKLQIKLEVDTNPVTGTAGRESFFVSRYDEIFPLVKHDLATLFAGKLLAIFCRPYARGRDYYDLIWYLSRHAPINLDYLNSGLRQVAGQSRIVASSDFSNPEEVAAALVEKVARANPRTILKDIGRFLEDPGEEQWINHYPEVLRQLIKNIG